MAVTPFIVRSQTFPAEQMNKILAVPGVYHADGHYEYPLSDSGKLGSHLDALFLIEPIVRQGEFIDWIVEDIKNWLLQEKIAFDLIFAPAQPAVQMIVDRLSVVTGVPAAYWQYYPSGWFGDKLVSGVIQRSSKALVFNAVSHTGRGVGERLPGFVEQQGAQVAAAAAFALGTTDGAKKAKEKFGKKLYAAIEFPINLYSVQTCPICLENKKPSIQKSQLIPWTVLRDQTLASPNS